MKFVFYVLATLVPRRSLLPRCPCEVWKKAGEDSLGDVTAHGGV